MSVASVCPVARVCRAGKSKRWKPRRRRKARRGLLWAKVGPEGASGPLGRFLDSGRLEALSANEGDLLLASAGEDAITSPALAATRMALARIAELPMVTEAAWLWVTDFPVFEVGSDGSLSANHHPFVLPHPDDAHKLDSDPVSVRGLAYDVVFNGTEFGSGSIRNHQSAVQRKIFEILGVSEEQIEQKFGFLLSALDSGAPPHGGMALGLDRIVQRFVGAESLRDVVAFPKTTTARALFEGAPSAITDADLTELHLRLAP